MDHGQVERMNRTIKEAPVKRFQYNDQLRHHLQDSSTPVTTANHGRRLNTLKRFTAYEYICKCWTKEPERFGLCPTYQILGLNT